MWIAGIRSRREFQKEGRRKAPFDFTGLTKAAECSKEGIDHVVEKPPIARIHGRHRRATSKMSHAMKKPLKRRVRPSNASRGVLSYRAIGGPTYTKNVFQLKSTSAPDELFRQFPIAFPNRNDLAAIHGNPFPRSFNELFAVPPLGQTARILNELVWAIAVCAQFGSELREFNDQRQKFERELLKADLGDGAATLGAIEASFGVSTWLVQNRILFAQLQGGSEGRRSAVKALEAEVDSERTLVRLLIKLISKRAETGSVRQLGAEISQIFEDGAGTFLESYLRNKLTKFFSHPISGVSETLFLEAQSSVIDYYEALLPCLVSVATDSSLPAGVADYIAKPLEVLHRRTADQRLAPIIRALGGVAVLEAIDARRAMLIESYSSGDFQYLLDSSVSYLSDVPDDILIFSLRVRAGLEVGQDIEELGGVLNGLASNLSDVFGLTQEAYASALSVFAVADRFAGHAWAAYLHAVLLQELREQDEAFPSAPLKRLITVDRFLTPYAVFAATGAARHELRNSRALSDAFPSTSQVVEAVLTGHFEAFIGTGEKLSTIRARHYMAVGESTKAIADLRVLQASKNRAIATRAYAAEASAHIVANDAMSAAKATIEGFLRNPDVPTIYPVSTIVSRIDSPKTWQNTIDVPLVYEMYLSYFGADKWPNLRYAFETFQTKNRIQSPKDLIARTDVWGLPRVIKYMSEVWKPEVMKQTLIYSDTNQMEQARIDVCRALSEVDPANATAYLDELRERVKHQEIAKGASLVEQSKVYVDVVAIKRTLKLKLGGSYGRYKTTMQAAPPTPAAVQAIYDLASDVGGTEQQSITQVLSNLVLMDIERSDADAQFDAIYSEITSEFLNGDHGLNAYLSTRVRHGKLRNAIRKASADEHLVTPRAQSGPTYLRNQFWLDQLAGLSPQSVQLISNALDAFSAELDSILDEINARLIRIKIASDVARAKDPHEEAFYYMTTNLERKYLQDFDRSLASLDDLIDRCVEVLWEKTDANLLSLQNRLDGEIRQRLMSCFDKLVDRIAHASAADNLGSLLNAIAQARTDTHQRVSHVMTWFKRSEVYDRQDYKLDYPVQIAHNIIRRTLSTASDWSNVEIHVEQDADLMPGRTLDGMVDIFDGLLDNAITHSGLAADPLSVSVNCSLSNGVFNARVLNNLAIGCPTAEAREKVDRIRDALGKSDSKHRAQLEGGSGLHKVWRTLNSPFYLEPRLEFGFLDDQVFFVEIGCRLERADDEDPSS